jgi:hypothetical protein
MNPKLKSLIAPLAVVLLLAVAFFAWYRIWRPPPPPNPNGQQSDPSPVFAVTDFDAFQKDLADRVSQKFGVDPATVVIAPAAYDLGWLLDSVQTYPADSSDCIPAPMPSAIPAPHLFPSYQLTSSTAATMTLGSDALQQLTSASLDLSHQANLVYSIDQVQVLLMDLKTVDHVSRTGACGDYVSQHPRTRLIRGLVLGKISFKFSTDNPISASAKLPKLGGISAKGDPNNSTVTVADDQPSQILEMVSILLPAPMPVSAAKPSPEPPPAPKSVRLSLPTISPTTSSAPLIPASPPMSPSIALPAPGASLPAPRIPAAAVHIPVPVPAGVPHIYFQQDIADAPGAGAAIAAKLHQDWPAAFIEAKVERVPTSKMPSAPQVRFFNSADQSLANTCHDHLKAATGIDARVVRIGLAAPAGQLEIWLQKVGKAP